MRKEPIKAEAQKPIKKEPIKDDSADELRSAAKQDLVTWILTNDFKVDHNDFSFDENRYLIEIYECDAPVIVVQKAAQMGLTIWLLLKSLHTCWAREPVKIGFFFPTDKAAGKLSKDRLHPIIEQNEELKTMIDKSEHSDTLGLKQFGKSSLYILHMGGSATRDSVPMDAVAFDEVRLLDPKEVDQALERISRSKYKRAWYISTAGYPGLDINARFIRGDQREYHSKCGCGPDPKDWVVLSEVFPECIVDDGESTYYCCPKCQYRINDPQNGEWVKHNPEGKYPSFHIHQMLSAYMSPEEILDVWQTTTNIKEFFNAKLGVPYVDKENIPITDTVLANCVNTAIPWTHRAHGEDIQTSMGVDQRGGQNHVVIAQTIRGKKRIIHLEVIDMRVKKYTEIAGRPAESPFDYLSVLMDDFDIDFCLCDALPNINEAITFGKKFEKRVFLAYYKPHMEMVRWSDKVGSEDPISIKMSGDDIKYKYRAFLDRYQSIEFSLINFVKRQVETPDPRSLVQTARMKNGRYGPVMICEEYLYPHLKGVIRQNVSKAEEAIDMRWLNLGLDPHFLHAWNYANMGLERIKSNFSFSFW